MQIQPAHHIPPPNCCKRFLYKIADICIKIRDLAIRLFQFIASLFCKQPVTIPKIESRPASPPIPPLVLLPIAPGGIEDNAMNPPSPPTPAKSPSLDYQAALDVMQSTPSPPPIPLHIIITPASARTSPTASTVSLESWVVDPS